MNQPKSVSFVTTNDLSSLGIEKKLVHGFPDLLNDDYQTNRFLNDSEPS